MTPTPVMPTCTVERNLPGLAARANAVLAPRLPRSAARRSWAVRAETIASSDIENTPLRTISARRMATLDHGKGCMVVVRLAGLPAGVEAVHCTLTAQGPIWYNQAKSAVLN